MWYSYRLKVYLSIMIFTLLALVFSFAETMILISSSVFRNQELGFQFHRLEQLTGVYFLFALPFILLYILKLNDRWKKAAEMIAYTGLVIAILMTIAALIYPDSFISITTPKETSVIYEADYTRGKEGVLYFVRDGLIGFVITFSLVSIIFDIIINSRLKQLIFPALGILFMTLGAIVDIMFIYTGINYDFFPNEYYSRFSLNLTIMLVFLMATVMRDFVLSSIELDKAEKTIRSSRAEKEVMLREIHHRVKNNMQVISSLLNLQAEYIVDDKDRQVFMDNSNRLLAMSMVHDKLYKTYDLSHINFKEYLNNFINELIEIYSLNPGDIKFYMNVDSVPVAIDKAIPCGIIIYEIVSNSIKHAFHGRNENTIRIDFIHNTGGIYQLKVSDNGRGFPADLSMSSSRNFGLHLIKGLVKQLDGSLTMNSDNGVTTNIIFRHPRNENRKEDVKKTNAAGNDHNRRKVIIVEDELITASFLTKILEYEGFSVIGTFSRGEDAIESLMNERPDFMVMDIILQGKLDGIDTIKQIKSKYNIPFIYLTAYSDDNIKERANSTNPGNYLVKPVEREILINSIKEIMNKK
jgi:two-component sensor histidine kinase/CheY-like chemotaxis protein